MDKLKYIRVQQPNGTYTADIPIAADASNVTLSDGTDVESALSTKVEQDELSDYVDTQMAEDVTDWLGTHLTTAGTSVLDDSLTIRGAAADAASAGSIVKVSATQPGTSELGNRIWIKPSEDQVELATYAELETVAHDIAAEYSSSSAYNVGDYVIYTTESTVGSTTVNNKKLYKCNTAISSSGEEWNSAHWTEVKLGEDISDLKSALSVLSESSVGSIILVDSVDAFDKTDLYKIDGTTTTLSNRYSTDFISCAGMNKLKYRLRGYRGNDYILGLISFFDVNKVFINAVPSPVLTVTEGETYIPDSAEYFRAIWLKVVSEVPYVIGYYSDSLSNDIKENKDRTESLVQVSTDLNPVFDCPFSYYDSGELIVLSSRFTSQLIKCDMYDQIEYSLTSFKNTTNTLDILTFFDKEMNYLTGLPASGSNGTKTGIIDVPQSAVYVAGNKLSSSSDPHYMRGVVKSSVGRGVKNVEAALKLYPTIQGTTIVSPSMTIADFITALNTALTNSYTLLTGCSANSFSMLNPLIDLSWDSVYNKVNHIFRTDVYFPGMTHDLFCNRVNNALTKNIWMWKDAKLNDGTPRDFSIAFTERSGEPSAIVSPDGSKLYVYGYDGRWTTEDGQTWSEKETVILDGESVGHANTNYIDGIYYMIAPLSSGTRDLVLYTSTDGLHFAYRGIVLPKSAITLDEQPVDLWGNSYLLKDNDKYYLYIEAKMENNVNFWDVFLCTCTDPLVDNGDGTVGNWQYSGTGAILGDDFTSSYLRAHGNPDIARGSDNRPIRVNGKWYMYYHVTYSGEMYIFRACSADLETWAVEGRIINNRDVPTSGENTAGNADHSTIEFKGKTYMFYTWDINSANVPYLKYVVDDRPYRTLLEMYP